MYNDTMNITDKQQTNQKALTNKCNAFDFNVDRNKCHPFFKQAYDNPKQVQVGYYIDSGIEYMAIAIYLPKFNRMYTNLSINL